MNIGIFTDSYFPQISGVVTSIRTLEKELNKIGHKVYIFTTTDPNAKESLPRVFRLPSMPFIFLPTLRMALAYPPKLLIKIKSLKLDVIHTQTEFPIGIFGKVVSEFIRVPLVHTYHTMYEDYVHYVARGHLVTPKMARQYSRIFCNRANTVIAPTEKTRDFLLSYGVVRPIEIVPTGVDITPFTRWNKSDGLEARKELGISESDPVVISVGRVAKEKSIDVVIKQFARLIEKLPNAKLVIVGAGPYVQTLMDLAGELGVRESVIFAGPRPWDSIGKYYQLGDVFVTASMTETQGLTHIEAMASKVSVVTKIDKSFEGVLIDGKTGYGFANDGDAADVMYEALTNKKKSAEMAEAAFERAMSLSSARFGKSVEDIYIKAINSKKAKA